jgi:hypothetical protein
MPTAPRPSLTRGHWLILGFWILLALIFTVISVLDSRGTSGWKDLLAFVAILLFVFAVAAIVISWAAARYLAWDSTIRSLILIVGPPVIVVVLVLVLRVTVG